MLLSILAVVLVCVLAVIIIVLNRKNTKSYNDLMEKGASAEKRIASLRADIDAGAEKAERTEEKLQRKIEAIDINGRNHSEALYIKAAEYTD